VRPELELATCFLPAQERVAGDFYFIGEAPNDATVVVVGDVVGKGLEAARRATFVRAALAAYAPHDDDPRRLLELANTTLVERAGTSQEFVTAACVVYRPADRSMSWALAGHPPPMLLDEGRRLNGVSPGLPLGLGETVEYARGDCSLSAGSGALLFTDGLIEARRPEPGGGWREAATRPDLFGAERIAAVLVDHRGEAHRRGESSAGGGGALQRRPLRRRPLHGGRASPLTGPNAPGRRRGPLLPLASGRVTGRRFAHDDRSDAARASTHRAERDAVHARVVREDVKDGGRKGRRALGESEPLDVDVPGRWDLDSKQDVRAGGDRVTGPHARRVEPELDGRARACRGDSF
jgi:stage II sporulation SpoE-like protein